jgi:hypothetical protein
VKLPSLPVDNDTTYDLTGAVAENATFSVTLAGSDKSSDVASV